MAEQKEKVTVWEAFDGTDFKTQKEAEEHESDIWHQVTDHLGELEESFHDIYLKEVLFEASKMWLKHNPEDQGWPNDRSWPNKNQKESYLFLKTLYRIHKYFEEYDNGDNFDWLK